MARTAEDILKESILLEKRGKAFYKNVAEKCDNEAAKQVFEMMAREEDAHINFLSAQFKNYITEHTFLISAALFFVQRNQIRKGKERSDELLLNILPSELAEELKVKGYAEAREFDKATILFSDFEDFTQQSARLSARELVDEINICFKAFDEIMEKYEIEKIKTIGDAYMAAGGVPVPSPLAVKNTILAALEMQVFISARNDNQSAFGKPSFKMRIGIHTGPVVAGIVGVKKFQYDIWGDTVNTASRLEHASDVGKVNISKATYELMKNDPEFRFEQRGRIEVKGKGQMEMYFIEKA